MRYQIFSAPNFKLDFVCHRCTVCVTVFIKQMNLEFRILVIRYVLLCYVLTRGSANIYKVL